MVASHSPRTCSRIPCRSTLQYMEQSACYPTARPEGPRAIRTPDAPWGLNELRVGEIFQVTIGTILLGFSLECMLAIALSQGSGILEHPKDSGDQEQKLAFGDCRSYECCFNSRGCGWSIYPKDFLELLRLNLQHYLWLDYPRWNATCIQVC